MNILKCKYCDFYVHRYNREGVETGWNHLKEHCIMAHKDQAKKIGKGSNQYLNQLKSMHRELER